MELQGNQGAQAMHPPEASANAAATDDDDDVLPVSLLVTCFQCTQSCLQTKFEWRTVGVYVYLSSQRFSACLPLKPLTQLY